jgi:hypothetical protein
MCNGVAVLLAICLLVACKFDEARQGLFTPATVTVVNESQEAIELTSISSTPNVESAFGLEGGLIRPGSTLSRRITEAAFEAIRSGDFVLEGTCGAEKGWLGDGKQLVKGAVHDPGKREIIIPIESCDS